MPVASEQGDRGGGIGPLQGIEGRQRDQQVGQDTGRQHRDPFDTLDKQTRHESRLPLDLMGKRPAVTLSCRAVTRRRRA
ncbi:hypothetical protein Psi02_40930 [Planotetraspora silvatica]|uniref:Uncharacterized protein n=1 Tax=Planotetraspora silvatica TaxID=234614 RepID=A0A8J3USN4_9ACTN|nr:hypothetical protein Psi02_40930 [Planotetraspora silvatica]